MFFPSETILEFEPEERKRLAKVYNKKMKNQKTKLALITFIGLAVLLTPAF